MLKKKQRVLFTREEIAREVRRIGNEIDRDYQGREVILAGVLKGAYLFIADLARAIEGPVVIDFCRIASYGAGTQSSGIIEFRKELEIPIRGKDVIIVEDVIDSGLTLEALYNKLLDQEPRSLKICTLIDKLARRETQVNVDYVGFTMDDGFIIGYGLDYDERYRNLPDIHVMDE